MHEIGHAIVFIAFTGKPVNIYIGSHGNKNGYHFVIGKFRFFIATRKIKFFSGMCESEHFSYDSWWKKILLYLSGVLFSFLISILLFYYPFFYPVHNYVLVSAFVLLLVSTFSLVVNLIPINKPVKSYDGRDLYTDGYKILKTVTTLFRKNPTVSNIENSLHEEWLAHLENLLHIHTKQDYLKYFRKYYSLGFLNAKMLKHAAEFANDLGYSDEAKEYFQSLKKL